MSRQSIVRILRETAALLELEGENLFRVRAYENAARTLEGASEEPEELLDQGRLAELPGIGPGMLQSVAEIVQTGRLTTHDQLRQKVPPGLLDLFRVAGLGPKRIRLLYQQLQIASPADLERACQNGQVAALPGFGAKSQAGILDGLTRLGAFRERCLLPEAEAAAAGVLTHLRGCNAVIRVEIAGALRRSCETIAELDFVAAVDACRRDEVAERFATSPGSQGLETRDETRIKIRLAGGLQGDLHLVEPVEFAAALLHFTGSSAHNIALRTRANQCGLSIDEHGLVRAEQRLAGTSEEEIYRQLGLHWIEPELREGMGEIDAAAGGPLPRLIESADLRGTFHVHTSWSDGIASLEKMAEAAGERGWDYLGVADHSRSAAYAGGLSVERVREQWQEIDAWNQGGRRPRIFKGIECDVLVDGGLDFDDTLLAGFDFVVASVHSRFRIGRGAMTARLTRAVSNPWVTFLGHPTGRLLLARDGYELDLDAVLEAAAEHGVIVELNASPHRLDIDWRSLRGWIARHCKTSIHPDAHSTQGLNDVDYGVRLARKARATAADVLNTASLDEIDDWFRSRRQRALGLSGLRS